MLDRRLVAAFLGTLILVIPVGLYLFQIFFVAWPLSMQYIYLSYASPNISSMFFSNFVHLNADHLFQNLEVYLMLVVSIAAIHLYVIPRINAGRVPIAFTDGVFLKSALVYFLLGPFVISGISILYWRSSGVAGGIGFSCIVAAFGGYYIYLARGFIIRGAFERLQDADHLGFYWGTILSFVIPVGLSLLIILSGILDPTLNAIGHLAGFVFGLMVPYALD
jgi:hypothetical protein